MLSDYTFLTDHSYSLRPVDDDRDDLTINRRDGKTKKRRQSSNPSNKTTPTANRPVSIDRSSSDKENNSLVLSSTNSLPTSTASSAANPKKSSGTSRTIKKKSIGSRLSARTAMTNARSHAGRKSVDKSPPKSSGVKLSQRSIIKKKNLINRTKGKASASIPTEFNDAPPSLSIEERVKLRRTAPLPSSTNINERKPVSRSKSQSEMPKTSTRKTHPVQNDLQQIRRQSTNNPPKKDKRLPSTKSTTVVSAMKAKKSFLGSGLDLDNILLGNRQRRGVQT